MSSVLPALATSDELARLDPQLRSDLGIVTAYLLDEAVGVLAADEHIKLDPEREVGREGVVVTTGQSGA